MKFKFERNDAGYTLVDYKGKKTEIAIPAKALWGSP